MNYFFGKILYGGKHYHCFKCDSVLSNFKNFDHISKEIFYSGSPPDELTSVVEFLEAEGMIKVDKYGVNITEKGKAKRDSGGYKRQILKERITWLGVIIGIIVGVTGWAIALYQLLYIQSP